MQANRAISVDESTPSSPSLSLADFDYDSDSPLDHPHVMPPASRGSQPIRSSHSNLPPTMPRDVPSPFVFPNPPTDAATQSDIASLRELIQRKFDKLQVQITPPNPPQPSTEDVSNALRAELAVQMAKTSVLEEEVLKLRAEKQALRSVLDKTESGSGLQKDLNSANLELQSVYVERQSLWNERQALWDERAALWKERGELWEERGDLWKERQSLWDEREDLWRERDALKVKCNQLAGRAPSPKGSE